MSRLLPPPGLAPAQKRVPGSDRKEGLTRLRPPPSAQRTPWRWCALTVAAEGGTAAGPRTISEVFICDLPDDSADLEVAGTDPVTGRPAPPCAVSQRRITFTAGRRHPGIQGPRHWLRSSPDGSRIAFLMKDDAGIVQLLTVSPSGGEPRQLTHAPWSIASCFTWSSDGRRIACVVDLPE